MIKKNIKVMIPILLFLIGIWIYQSLGRSLGIRWIQSCPTQSLNKEEVNTLYRTGLSMIEDQKRGEYYLRGSLEEGLPLLYRAALHGHRDAIRRYRTHLTQAGIIEMQGIIGLSSLDAAVESLMWSLVLIHLKEKTIPKDEQERYRILLDPKHPFPHGYFNSHTGSLGWSFQMMTHSGVHWARLQAWEWRSCWK